MKLSKDTLELLDNFADINPNFYSDGAKSTISTMAEAKNIVALADTETTFGKPISIYDLKTFLAAIKMIKDNDIELNADHCVIKSGRSRFNYRFADKSILTILEKEVNFPTAVVKIDLDDSAIRELRSAASTLGNSELSFHSTPEGTAVSVVDPKDKTASSFTLLVSDTPCPTEFDFRIAVGNMKILADSYTVEFAPKKISKWTAASKKVTYFIAVEESSSYN